MKTKRIRTRGRGSIHVRTAGQRRIPHVECWDGHTGYVALYLTDIGLERLIGALSAIRIERASARRK